jgi:predicted TIM-barrel fold metal-dependent hydrolase
MNDYADWLISVDDHVIEPAHVWQRHVAPKFRDRAPKVVNDNGIWKWDLDGKRDAISGMAAVAGRPAAEWDPRPMNLAEPASPWSGEPRARLAAMDRDHVIASMVFPTYTGFCGQTFLHTPDKELGLACIRAYNDWMIDEWTATAPDRFIPLAQVPMWDGTLAAAEARRVAAKGAKAISFSENPASLGLPSIHDRNRYWDPLFKVCVDHGMPLCIHLGSSARRVPAPDEPMIEAASFMALGALDTFIDWMWSGNLLRYPELKIVLSESGISWLPSVLQRMRRDLHRWRWARTAKADFDGNLLTGDMKFQGDRSPFGNIPEGFDPLETFHRSIFASVIAGDVGWDGLAFLGADNIMIETDFPHPDSEFPHSAAAVQSDLAVLPADQKHKIMRDNACRVFAFTPARPSSLPIA